MEFFSAILWEKTLWTQITLYLNINSYLLIPIVKHINTRIFLLKHIKSEVSKL